MIATCAADTQAEVRPYILEFSHTGELVSTRKLQFNQEQQCQHRDALLSVVFENARVVVRNCAGGRDLSTLNLAKNREAKLPLRGVDEIEEFTAWQISLKVDRER